ncbi:MAG TPA: galactose-1-phosphate uridylyltransferase [Longimicrobiales bacterium]|nr:galactose-1-phosphate uridylyltransferase [Longimicrobiales bacterium]
MMRARFRKSDGRYLILYGDRPLPPDLEIPQPGPGVERLTELRWHPFRAEWVAYAAHRQERTFLPPPDWDPLAPSVPGAHPTELPAGPWKVAVFENRFPALHLGAAPPPANVVETRPSLGACEVVVYTPEWVDSLADLPTAHVEMLIDVWAERTEELGAHEAIRYVMPFENRGAEVGATLHHPHGQIYAYPFVPPVAAAGLEQQRAHMERRGTGLLESHLEAELRDGRRVIRRSGHALSFVPAFARYPYEAWVAPLEAVPSLARLTPEQRTAVALALQDLVRRYDAVRGTAFPYVMVVHQAPTDGAPHPEAHVRFEFYPQYRSPDRLKYLAGTEVGAGMFVNDTLPEQKAAELRALAPLPAEVPS